MKFNDFFNLRVCTLYNVEHFFIRISKRNLFSMIFSISIMICLPSFFTVELLELKHDNLWTWKLSEFGISNYGRITNISLIIFEFIIPVISLVILSFISKIKYDRIINRKVLMKDETEDMKNKKILLNGSYIDFYICDNSNVLYGWKFNGKIIYKFDDQNRR